MVGPGCFLTLSSRVRVVPSGWAWLSGPGGRSAIKAAASSLLFFFYFISCSNQEYIIFKIEVTCLSLYRFCKLVPILLQTLLF